MASTAVIAKQIPFKIIIIFVVVFILFFWTVTGEWPWRTKAA